MIENEIKINFILNCALISFLKNGEIITNVSCKYDKASVKRFSKFITNFKRRYSYDSAAVIFKLGKGVSAGNEIIDNIRKGGIDIISISCVEKL